MPAGARYSNCAAGGECGLSAADELTILGEVIMKANLAIALAVSALAFAADDQAKAVKHIDEAANVFTEINAAPDKGIPHDILEKAQCIGIVPSLKRAGFIVGGKYGKGVVVCREANGWSAPSNIRIEGGSVGFQIGAGETDLVFIVMNQRGMDKLMQDKFTVGGDASAMAGPVGRSAEASEPMVRPNSLPSRRISMLLRVRSGIRRS